MPHMKFRLDVAVCCVALLLSAIPLANASSLFATTTLVVPDEGNNRVLLYSFPVTNGQAANVVLGQSSFSTSAPGTSASTMGSPSAYAVDQVGNLYVSDTLNCRVLQFRPPFTNGEAAQVVIGKPDANTSCGGAATASNLGRTGGVAFDETGNLWVADPQNSRVLRFKPPFKTGKAANLVVGQPDFVSDNCTFPPTASSLCGPVGIAFDANNYLWVADSRNNRILEFKAPQKNTANLELGQPAATAFTSSGCDNPGVSASSLCAPEDIGFDPQNRLWVADSENSRVLRFDPNYHNGGPAALVLGQKNFTASSPNQNLATPNAGTLSFPVGIVVEGDQGLWVGDTSNNRSLQFAAPAANGTPATIVLGQANFTSNQPNQGNLDPSDQTENNPFYNAGPSVIALAVLAGLAGGRQWMHRLRLRS